MQFASKIKSEYFAMDDLIISVFVSTNRKSKVPEILITTIEIPDNLQIVGRGCLIHAQACRFKNIYYLLIWHF